MNNETKERIKKNVATGASTVAGATAGVFIGAAVNTATAEEVVTPETTSQPEPKPDSKPQPAKHNTTEIEPIKPPVHEPEVEVVGYDRVTNEDGSQMDIAVLNVDDDEVGVIDANLDGEADALIHDANQDGVIDEGEMQIVQGQGIAMQPFQDAVGFNPQYAQNDLPDYVNDADVDSYMA